MGKVEIVVCAARNLHNEKTISVSSPFTRIICGDKNYKTKVVEKNLNPEWNETFRFQIPDEMSSQIRFEVWGEGTCSDDLLGIYSLSVGGLTKGVVRDGWYILDKSKTQAELHIRVLATDFGLPPKPEEQWMVTTDIARDPVKRAVDDGTWRPGQKAPPPPSGPPQAGYAPAPYVPQSPAPYVQPQPQPQPQNPYVSQTQQPTQVQYTPQQPSQVQYVSQQQPQMQYMPQQQPQMQYMPQQQQPQMQYMPQQQQPQMQYMPQQQQPQMQYMPQQQQPQMQYMPQQQQPQMQYMPQQPQQGYYPQPPPAPQQPQGYYAPAPGYRY